MANYTDLTELKADLPDLDSGVLDDYDNVLSEMITAASRLIDREVGGWENYFYPSTVDSTRYYDGNGEVELYIDPMASLTSVSVAESGGRASASYTDWEINTDYYTWPYNTTDTGDPIRALIIDNDTGSKGTFCKDRKSVKVIGVFGYSSEPPEPIQQACKIQAMRWFMRSKQSYQDTSASERLGQMLYVQELDPDVKRLLMPYKIGNMML